MAISKRLCSVVSLHILVCATEGDTIAIKATAANKVRVLWLIIIFFPGFRKLLQK
jgi:hypothetical protein